MVFPFKMCGRRFQCRRMTLVEMMFSLSISAMVLALLQGFLVQPFRLWQQGLAQWQLDSQTRMVRERMLRGISNQYGLREAELGSMKIKPGSTEQVEWIDFDVDAGDQPSMKGKGKVTCRISENDGNPLSVRTVPGSGKPISMLRGNVECRKLKFEQSGRTISTEMELAITVGGRTYTRESTFSTRLIND